MSPITLPIFLNPHAPLLHSDESHSSSVRARRAGQHFIAVVPSLSPQRGSSICSRARKEPIGWPPYCIVATGTLA